MYSSIRLILIPLLPVLLLCSSAWGQNDGRLVIVGGALNPEHAAIYHAFLQNVRPEQPVGVIPLASGVPERSGPGTVQDIRQYAPDPERVYDTELRHDDHIPLTTAEGAADLEACAALWFTGGDQIRILRAMRPDTGDTPGYDAVRAVLTRGGTIGGTSAGAAMMSRWMITGGSSEEAIRLGANEGYDVPGVGYTRGMDLFPYGVVDQHFLRRGRFGRLLVVTRHLQERFGFGVSENAAMVVDLTNDSIQVVGDHGLTVIDLDRVNQDGPQWTNIRVSLLSNGDRFDPQTGSVKPAPQRTGLSPDPAMAVSRHTLTNSIWDDYAIREMIMILAHDRGRVVEASDAARIYTMTADAETHFFTSGDSDEPTITAENVRLDISPKPSPDPGGDS